MTLVNAETGEIVADISADEAREITYRFNVCPHCPHLTWHNGDPCPSKETAK